MTSPFHSFAPGDLVQYSESYCFNNDVSQNRLFLVINLIGLCEICCYDLKRFDLRLFYYSHIKKLS